MAQSKAETIYNYVLYFLSANKLIANKNRYYIKLRTVNHGTLKALFICYKNIFYYNTLE